MEAGDGDDDITALIRELRRVRIEEAGLIDRLEAATERQQRRHSQQQRRHSQHRTPSHQPPTSVGATPLRVGDEVYITNQVKKPVTWRLGAPVWSASQERQAIVQRIDGNRVYILTGNGVVTWRASRNLTFVRHHGGEL